MFDKIANRGQRSPSRAGRMCFERFLGDRAGSSMMFVALGLPVIFGMAGLGLDVGIWYLEKRQNQTVADNAVLTAVMELQADPNLTDAQLLQKIWADANRNGYDNTATRDIIVNRPPSQGAFTDPALGAVEVLVQETRPLYLAAALLPNSQVTIEGRSVGRITSGGSHCVLSLDNAVDGGIHMWGTSDVELDCGVAANSSSDKAIWIEGNASMTADPAQAFGDIMVDSNATLITNSPPQPYSQRMPDPYGAAGRNIDINPPAGPCISPPINTLTTDTVLNEGVYCGGLWLKSGTFTFNPGVYIIYDGDFRTNGGAVLNGTDVTIILTGSGPGSIGTFKMNGGTEAQLYAPGPGGHTSGPYAGQFAGVLIYVDRNAPSFGNSGKMIEHAIQGGADADFRGAIYAPSQLIQFAGGADVGPRCLQVIARKVTFQGNADLDSSEAACNAQGAANIAQMRVRVVE